MYRHSHHADRSNRDGACGRHTTQSRLDRSSDICRSNGSRDVASARPGISGSNLEAFARSRFPVIRNTNRAAHNPNFRLNTMSDIFSAPHFHNDIEARKMLERILWPNGPICPHCGVINSA